MGGDHHPGAALGEGVERGHRRDDAAPIGDVGVVVERDVQVGAHKHPAPRNPPREKIIEGGNSEIGHVYSDLPTIATRSTSRFE